MTFITAARLLHQALWAGLLPLAALAACTAPQPPMAMSAQAPPAVPADPAVDQWPAPAAPLDTTPIGPVETAGAAAND